MSTQLFFQNVGSQLLHRRQISVGTDGHSAEQSHGTHLTGEGGDQVLALTDHDFRGAAADVNHAAHVSIRCTEEGKGSFLFAGTDLHFHMRGLPELLTKILRIGGIPNGAGGKQIHLLSPQTPGFDSHEPNSLDGFAHGFGTQVVLGIQSGKQAGSFPVTQYLFCLSLFHVCDKHSHGVGTDTDDGCTHGHSPL